MKRIPSSRKHDYAAKVCIFLIVAAFVVGMASCGAPLPAPSYDLTMAASSTQGGTATDLTGASPYTADATVSIEATIASAYRFVGWDAPAGTFADATALTTTFTMPAQPVTVTALFQGQPGLPPYNYLDCYLSTDFQVNYGDWSGDVVLDDQFNAFDVLMGEPCCFCDPVSVSHYEDGDGGIGQGWTTVIASPDHHLTIYTLDVLGPLETWSVMVENQFGMQQLTVQGPHLLAVPTQKVEPHTHEAPVGLDHFLIYAVMEGPEVNVLVDLADEFGPYLDVVIAKPAYFGNPVRKRHEGMWWEVENPAAHLVFYSLEVEDSSSQVVQCIDQFGDYSLGLERPYLLAVPSWKSYAHPVPPM